MKKINFINSGGFPLEQETLARLQSAYRDELYEMLKRSFDIQEDQVYVISEPTNDENGWFIINGVLHLMEAGTTTPTNVLRTAETTIKLRYGDGLYKPAYIDYTVEYANEIPDNYNPMTGQDDMTLSEPNDRIFRFYNIANLPGNTTPLRRIGFLPIDGSKPMEGDLDMGGNQLSNLDTLETALATLRAKYFEFGSSTQRGDQGRALVDENIEEFTAIDDVRPVNPDNTALHLNYNSDWGTTVIGGEIKFPEFAENSTSTLKSPLLIDNKGNVCKGRSSESIPLGLITLWFSANGQPPLGWVFCDEDNDQIGNITIPDLDDNSISVGGQLNFSAVRYIIFVGRDTPTINAAISGDFGERESFVLQILSGQDTYDATADASFTLSASLENLTFNGWTQFSGPNNSTIATPNGLTTHINGTLIEGTYVYEATGQDAQGAQYMDRVTIVVARTNRPPIFNSIVNPTTGTDITSNTIFTINREINSQIQLISVFEVAVSDPDGDIFDPSVTIIARITSNGVTRIINPFRNLNVSEANIVNTIRTASFGITGLLDADIIEFEVTDVDGGRATKSYTVNVVEETSIVVLPDSISLGNTEVFNVRLQGTPNTTEQLSIQYLTSTVLNGSRVSVNDSDTGSILGQAIMTQGTSQTFSITFGANGEKNIRVTHIGIVPRLTVVNSNTFYTLNSRISLTSNPGNRELITSLFEATDLILIEEDPIDDGNGGGGNGGGGGGGDVIIADNDNDFPQNQL
ncbi:hypothetical protein [Dokdonia sp.]|uniref:PKD domain-containing protein n=1 Tax=Dokdonia sp. TaxID=2024995 RepID=UPI003263043A